MTVTASLPVAAETVDIGIAIDSSMIAARVITVVRLLAILPRASIHVFNGRVSRTGSHSGTILDSVSRFQRIWVFFLEIFWFSYWAIRMLPFYDSVLLTRSITLFYGHSSGWREFLVMSQLTATANPWARPSTSHGH